LPLIFEYVLGAFKKMQDAVKNRITVMETPLPRIGFQPSRVVGETADMAARSESRNDCRRET
jgi:hypothetical protein